MKLRREMILIRIGDTERLSRRSREESASAARMAGRAAEMVLLPLPSIPRMQTWRVKRALRFLLGICTQALARTRGSPQPAGSGGRGKSSGLRRGRTPRCYDRAAGSRRVPGPRSESSGRPGVDGGGRGPAGESITCRCTGSDRAKAPRLPRAPGSTGNAVNGKFMATPTRSRMISLWSLVRTSTFSAMQPPSKAAEADRTSRARAYSTFVSLSIPKNVAATLWAAGNLCSQRTRSPGTRPS